MSEFRSGFVGIFGKPNAGKSTLLNSLIEEKLAIVSPKAQTTRSKLMAVLTTTSAQIIFLDTPGIVRPSYQLHHRMLKEINEAKKGLDLALYITDLSEPSDELKLHITSLAFTSPLIIVVNKIDKLSAVAIKNKVDELKSNLDCEDVLPVSASQKINMDLLIDKITHYLPIHPPYYDEDTLTDRPMRYFVSEIIREKMYLLLDDELPYHSAVIVQSYKVSDQRIRIDADIIVGRESQKAIVIGKGGSKLTEIGSLARKDIEQFLQQKVHLQLYVKVRENWRNTDTFLNEYGY